MKRTWILSLAAVAMALLVGGMYATSASAQKAPGAGASGPKPPQVAPPALPGSCGEMIGVASPMAGRYSRLDGVSALSSNDVWAVGYYDNSSVNQTLVEHWDGTAWTISTSQNVRTGSNYLYGVSALASNDVWAVGDSTNGSTYQTLVEHWDGTVWNVVTSANPSATGNFLSGVSARAYNDIWAVGNYYNGGVLATLVERWTGTAWAVIPSPDNGTTFNYLTSVSARAADDAWTVGYYVDSSNTEQTLVEHWNGGAWSVVQSAGAGNSGNYLNGVSALASDDVWAVGDYINTGSPNQTMIEHWNGTVWSIVPSWNIGSGSNYLNGVSALASNDVWAVGYSQGTFAQMLVEHWNGAAWSVIPNGLIRNGDYLLTGVSGLPGGDVWTVGYSGTPGQTLTERYGGPCPCTTSFSDVHSTDYFYTPVLYLACHGVISGYSDGTFRPYANTTRSQMVKIVVLGFSKPIVTPAAPDYSFADVPRTNPFFDVVETAYAGGIVSGYTCGVAPAGPCDSANRPYFLPYANVTRSQLSKIDVIAAGWTLYNPATPTFSDVAHGSTFYQVIETAVCHGVISGYSDHTFRPFNNATRGQISKIIYLSIVTPPVSCGP